MTLLAYPLAAMVGGVVGSVAPVVPSGLLSLAGVGVYWWGSGFSEPNLLVLSGVLFVALLAVVTDWLSGAVSAKAGGASTRTVVVATLVGLPVAVHLGVAGRAVPRLLVHVLRADQFAAALAAADHLPSLTHLAEAGDTHEPC